MLTSSSVNAKPTPAVVKTVPVISNAVSISSDLVPRTGVLVMSFLAMVIVQMFRSGHSTSITILVAEVVIFSALPWIVYGCLLYTSPSPRDS